MDQFYRDQGDEYVTRKFDFSDNAEDLVGFIKNRTLGWRRYTGSGC